jgi:MarR family transcriptional regulator, organic hydroperoxide resistance regulator
MERSETIKKINVLQRELGKTMRGHAFNHWMTLSLSTTQVKSLMCIVENDRISSKKLAEMLDVTPANVTGIVDKLIEQGYVRRVENAQDRRVVFLESTDAGKNLMANLEQMASEFTTKMLSSLNDDELGHLYLGMSAFLKAARTQAQPEDKLVHQPGT